MKYRLYVDEVGNADLGASADPNHRYLSLTGLAFELSYVAEVLQPRLEDLKRRFFGSHPDDPVILHRKELLNRRPPFQALKAPPVAAEFDKELLALLEELEFTVWTAIIDKLEHQERYEAWHFDPYHYSLTVLVERFVLWLGRRSARGDVMAESRGGREDTRLKNSFRRLCEQGSDYLGADAFQARLTSLELKVKPKANNIAGLQVADLLAHPSFAAAVARQRNENLPTTFGGRIAELLERLKFDRSPAGGIDGWGRKWLP